MDVLKGRSQLGHPQCLKKSTRSFTIRAKTEGVGACRIWRQQECNCVFRS
jgi:hypothetical protein